MSLPKEPRQLMINLMYLVLTALLAMNVSSEILNAFKIVNRSINSSSKNIANKNDATIENFKMALEEPLIQQNPEKLKKVQDFLAIAEQAVDIRKKMEVELEGYKKLIIERAGGMDPNSPGNILREDDLDAATAIMVEGPRKGEEMKTKLQAFKSQMAALVPIGDDAMSKSSKNENMERLIPIDLTVPETEDNKNADWSFGNFHMVPAVAAVTLMDKYINDVKNTESLVLDELWAKAFGERKTKVIPLPDYALMVSSPNSYLLPGEKYTANIMLGAYNKSSNNLSIRVNGAARPIKDGIATYETVASGKGEQKITVTATFMDPNDNQPKNYKAEATYYVGDPQATISLDKMNVFYVGVPNPITFSASGIPANNLSYTAENCVLKAEEGVNKYSVMVEKPGAKAKITLSGKKADGTIQSFGTYEYRVKRIPDPYPVIANKRGGGGVANEMKVQDAIIARLDNFDFDAKFVVTSFSITYVPRRGEPEEGTSETQYLTGARANPKVAAIMAKLKPGDKVYFENIRAVGPDKTSRNIGSLAFVINN